MQYFHVNHISEHTPKKHLEAGDVVELSSKRHNPYYKSILNRQKHIAVDGRDIPLLEFFKNIQRGKYEGFPGVSDPLIFSSKAE